MYNVVRQDGRDVHIVLKKVPLRFVLYLGSSAVLMAMWIGFFVDAVGMAGPLAQP